MIDNHFVGRGDAVQRVRDVLSGKTATGGKLTVQSIEGPGGIGKTFLLDHAIDGIDLSSRNYLVMRIDGNDLSSLTLTGVIERLVNGARAKAIQGRPPGDSFPDTIKTISLINDIQSEAVTEFISLLQEKVENIDSSILSDSINGYLEMCIRKGAKLAVSIPWVGPFLVLSGLDDKLADYIVSKSKSLQIEKIGIKDKLAIFSRNKALRNAIKENACLPLAESLYSDLAAILFEYLSKKRFSPSRPKVKGIDRLLLIIDDYEKLQEPLGTFLVSHFLPALKKADFESVVIILGRDHLQATNTGWEQYLKSNMMKNIDISPLSRAEMDQLVESYGIQVQAEKERAWSDTKGYPYYVQLWIDEVAEGGLPGSSMLKQFHDRTTRWMSEKEKEWLQHTLFLDAVNIRTLKYMLGDEKLARQAFSWFECEGSVRDPKGTSFCVREYIRTRLKEYLRICDPDRFTELQNKGYEAMNNATV